MYMVAKTDKILITGGTGFIGSYIIRYLLHEGYKCLIGLHRESSTFELLVDVKDHVTWVLGDITDPLGMDEIISKLDVVVHAAAVVSFDDRDSEAMISANRDGTANLINASLAQNVKKFIHISSVAALGKPMPEKDIDEKTEWVESKNNSPYSLSKRASELEVWRGHAEGLHVSILNPSVVLGAGFWDRTSSKIIGNMHRGQKLYPKGGNGFVDVRDVAKAVLRLIANDHNGNRYVLNGANLKFKELMDQMADNYGIPKAEKQIADWMIPISWRLFKVISFITQRPTVYAKHTVISTSKIWKYNALKSIDELGLEYIPITQTLAESCDAFLESKQNNLPYGILEII